MAMGVFQALMLGDRSWQWVCSMHLCWEIGHDNGCVPCTYVGR